MDSSSVLMAAQQLLELSRNFVRTDRMGSDRESPRPDSPAKPVSPPMLNGFVRPHPHPPKDKVTHVSGLVNGDSKTEDLSSIGDLGSRNLANGPGVSVYVTERGSDMEVMSVEEEGEEDDRTSHLTVSSSHSPSASPPPPSAMEDGKEEVDTMQEGRKEGDLEDMKKEPTQEDTKKEVEDVLMDFESSGMSPCVGM